MVSFYAFPVIFIDTVTMFLWKKGTLIRGVARNLIWVGINGSRRQNNHIKKFKVG